MKKSLFLLSIVSIFFNQQAAATPPPTSSFVSTAQSVSLESPIKDAIKNHLRQMHNDIFLNDDDCLNQHVLTVFNSISTKELSQKNGVTHYHISEIEQHPNLVKSFLQQLAYLSKTIQNNRIFLNQSNNNIKDTEQDIANEIANILKHTNKGTLPREETTDTEQSVKRPKFTPSSTTDDTDDAVVP